MWVDPRRHGARWHEVSRRVEGHAGPLCPGLQTLPLRAAFAPTGAFGSACFVVSARRSARLSPSRARLSDPFFRSCKRSVPASVRQTPGPQTSLSACRPSIPHVNPLFRAWATPPTCETAGPRAKQQAHVQDSRPTCETASPRAGQQAHVRDSRPTCETASPRAKQQAHVQDSRPTCGTARSRAWGEGRHRYAAPALTLSSPLT